MFTISRFKAIIVATICALGILFALPNLVKKEDLQTWPSWLRETVSLGLELQGGSHLQFEVDFKAVEKESLHNRLADVRAILRKNNVGYVGGIRVDETKPVPTIEFKLSHFEKKDIDQLIKLIGSIDNDLQVTIGDAGQTAITLSPEKAELRNKQIIDQSVEVIRKRIDESGTKEPSIIPQGSDRIVVQLPGVTDPGEVRRLIGKTAKLSFKLAVTQEIDADQDVRPPLPAGAQWLPVQDKDKQSGRRLLIGVEKETKISGDQLIDAQYTTTNEGKSGVLLKFNKSGAARFAHLTTQYFQKQFAITLDDVVISAPVMSARIMDGVSVISGNFTAESANELALLLRAGALPAPLKVVEERTVGPSLGADSIHDGKNATIFAFILVATFMILGYSLFGVFANIALAFNLILLFAGLSLLGATLTLPGIAGIAMTIGMAVDANVLIYERIKEELRKGLTPHHAIEAGYNRAMSTIIDSNLTTLIGAAALFEFGSGSIRGFAVTLALGILISMFTALSVTKLITAWWFRGKKLSTLPI